MQTVILFLITLQLGSRNVHCKRPAGREFCHPCKCHKTMSGITADCSKKNLNEIPSSIPDNVTSLDMSNNNISELVPNILVRFHSLRHLDFSKNTLTSLNNYSFSGAIALETLVLHGNAIALSEKSYPAGVFRHQRRLVTLDISKNVMDTKGVYPHDSFSDLTSLQTLYVDGVENATFGQKFVTLSKLSKLSLPGNRGYCAIYSLSNHSFANTLFVTFLDISKCRIFHIEVNTFGSLRYIEILDVSDNRYLVFDDFGDAMYGLQFSPLRVLKINRIVDTFAIGVMIKDHHFRYLINMSVKQLHADNNKIELVSVGVLALATEFEIISVKNGRFTYGEYLLALDALTNLREIYFNDQYISDDIPLPRSDIHRFTPSSVGTRRHELSCREEMEFLKKHDRQISRSTKEYPREITENCKNVNVKETNTVGLLESGPSASSLSNKDNLHIQKNPKPLQKKTQCLHDQSNETEASPFIKTTIPLPPNVTLFNASNSKLNYNLPEMRFFRNRIKTIDASNNLFTRWIGPFHGIERVEFLDISNNYCEEIAPTFLKFATGLKVLNISKNFLATSFHNDTNGQLFYNQTNLEVLRIANNIIRELPASIFSRQTKLKELDLSWNMMEMWTADISHMTFLESLGLAKNRFDVVPKNLRQQIDTLMKSRNNSFHLKINKNYLKCDCQSLDSLEWMLKPNIVIDDLSESECRLPDGSVVCLHDLEGIVLKLQQQCKTIIPIVIGTVAGLLLFLTLTVAGVIYRYRWKLRYLYYTTRRKYRGYQRLAEEQHHFTYDAFVSYADEDRDFVVHAMCTMLEERFGLRLCIHQRDFMVGEPITSNIINAIQSSRKTLVVLSPYFVESSWCEYEVRMAKLESVHTGRDLMCVVWYADVPDREAITGDLLEEILNDTYIRYPEAEREQELFWTTLKESLEY